MNAIVNTNVHIVVLKLSILAAPAVGIFLVSLSKRVLSVSREPVFRHIRFMH